MADTMPATPIPVYGSIVTTPSGNVPVEGTVSVGNFPATQPVSGTVGVNNFPATQPVSGTVSISNLPVTQPVSGTVAVSNLPATQPVSGTVAVSNFPAAQTTQALQVAAYTKTTTNVLLISVQIAAANASRRGFIIWNNSANSVYVTFETPATSAAPVNIIATFTSWVHMFPVCYTGAIYAIRNAGSGNCVVWEF